MRLITNEGKVVCPQCEVAQDLLAYTKLKNLNPTDCADIIKCKLCRHVFAPNQ